MPWAEGSSKQYHHHKKGGEIISIYRARCCWFHGFPKCILLGIGMIIRQLGDWLKRAPGGESETTGKDILILTRSGTTIVSQMLRLCRENLPQCCWILILLNQKNDSKIRRKSLKSLKQLFRTNHSISILCGAWWRFLSYWKRTAKAGFGRSSTYADENLLPDYTCLECGWVFYPLLL